MFEAFVAGLMLVFQWKVFAYLLLGVAIGIWLGAVPGLGGISGLALLMPFTYGMETVPAMALLLGMLAVINTSDTIPAVLIGVPGTAAAQATVLDGFPLAQKGHGARALGAAFTSSAMGGVFGAFALALCLPLLLPIILAFGSPENFALGVLGLAMVGSLSGESVLKGLAVAALGLLFSTVGYADSAAVPRYWFGLDYLIENLPFLPMVLGLFALAEILDLALRDRSISSVPRELAIGGHMMAGIRDAFRNWWLVVRCSTIGAYIGLLPGLGAVMADWMAYSHAVQTAKDKSQFGRGDIRGVIGPESANNATLGGDLIPTVAFGIPGSVSMAILITAFLVQGLKPGPEMLTVNAHITFNMVWTVAIANVFAALLLMVWSRQVAKLAFIPGQLVVPGVILFLFMGAWFANASIGDWISCLFFGVLGYFMKRGGWPRPPLILAMVLGDIMENALVISVRAYDGWGWLTRPIVLVIAALVVLTIVFSARGIVKSRQGPSVAEEAGEGTARNPFLSFPMAALLFVVFIAAAVGSLQWTRWVRQFPLTAALPGILFTFLLLFREGFALRLQVREQGGLAKLARMTAEKAQFVRAAQFFGYLLGMFALMLLTGHKIAMPVFVATYLMRWGHAGWRTALVYAFCAWLVLVVFYDRVLSVFWYRSPLADFLVGVLPAWVPSCLFT